MILRSFSFSILVSIVLLGYSVVLWSLPPLRPGQSPVPGRTADRSIENTPIVTQPTRPSISYSLYFATCIFPENQTIQLDDRLDEDELDNTSHYYLGNFGYHQDLVSIEYWEQIPVISRDISTHDKFETVWKQIYVMDVIPRDSLRREDYSLGEQRSYSVFLQENAIRVIYNYDRGMLASRVLFNRDGRRSRFALYESGIPILTKYYYKGKIARLDVYKDGTLYYYQLFLYNPVTEQAQTVLTRASNQTGQVTTRLENGIIRTDLFDIDGQRRRSFFYEDTNELQSIYLFNEDGIPMVDIPFPQLERHLPEEDEETDTEGSPSNSDANAAETEPPPANSRRAR
jgi:hypothetical protein